MVKVRIRGIFSTALTSILSKHFTIVQQSLEIIDRFSTDQRLEESDVTIKDSNDKSYLIVLGYVDISQTLRGIFKTSVVWNSPVKLYSVISTENCEYKGFEVDPCLDEGIVIKVPFDDGIIGLSQPKAVSKYAFLWRSEKGVGTTFFSEHLKDYETRTKLLSVSIPMNRKGYNIKWRSNARFLDLKQLKEEVEKLMIRYENHEFKDQGEFFSIIIPSLEDRKLMDEERRKIMFTTNYHHMLKVSYGKEVDEIESPNVICPKQLLTNILDQKSVETVEHIKPDGTILNLRGGKIIEGSIDEQDCSFWLKIKREFNSFGIYDGLNVRKEPGDYDIFLLSSKDWYSIHTYFSKDGEVKGSYVNVSTPSEIYKGGRIRYIDLDVDVIINKDGELKVIDQELLDENYKRGLITETLYKKALGAVDYIVKNKDKILNKTVVKQDF